MIVGYIHFMQVEKISDSLHRLTFSNGDEVVLIGTAHVSSGSVELVQETIEKENPDRICIELDNSRMKSKSEGSSWKDMDIRKVIRDGKGFFLLANTALASFQKRMGNQTGITPGDEILKAASIAKEKNIPLSLCDREIQTTFKRAWAKSSIWNKCKLLATLISAAFSNETLTEEELEELKKQDTLESMMNEIAKELPTVKEVLIDERDRYLATSVYQAEGKKKVVVIGAGHTNGIIKTLGKLESGEIGTDINEINSIPKAKPWGKIASYIIPSLIILLVILGIVNTGWDQGIRMFLYWMAACALSTGIFSILALAHPLNILLSAVTAPFFALNPVLGIGMLAGVLEATFRKPKVRDFEGINDDATSLKGWYKNRILHALLVFLLSSIGSMIGTFIAFPMLISHL